jgi:hypothetical protein
LRLLNGAAGRTSPTRTGINSRRLAAGSASVTDSQTALACGERMYAADSTTIVRAATSMPRSASALGSAPTSRGSTRSPAPVSRNSIQSAHIRSSGAYERKRSSRMAGRRRVNESE